MSGKEILRSGTASPHGGGTAERETGGGREGVGRERGGSPGRGLGLAGRVAVSASMAGGILLGGFVVAGMTLTGRLSADGLFLTSSGLFLVGAVLGYLHGAVLGFLGRERGPRAAAATDVARGTLYAVPALAFAWVVSGWVALTVVVRYTGGLAPWTGVALGWLAGAGILAAAATWGWRALRNAYGRWPERRPGTVVVAATFAALLVTLLAGQGGFPGWRLDPTPVGAVLLAAALALWLVGPAVTLVTRLLGRSGALDLPLGLGEGRRALANLTLGLAAGGALALLALPFHRPPLAVPALPVDGVLEGLLLAVSRATVAEVLFRLVALTGAFWLLVRWRRVHRAEAAVLAVTAVALLQLALFAPGLMALGFPGLPAGAAFATAAVLVPSLVFGALYLTRGLGTALVADATAIGALALLL